MGEARAAWRTRVGRQDVARTRSTRCDSGAAAGRRSALLMSSAAPATRPRNGRARARADARGQLDKPVHTRACAGTIGRVVLLQPLALACLKASSCASTENAVPPTAQPNLRAQCGNRIKTSGLSAREHGGRLTRSKVRRKAGAQADLFSGQQRLDFRASSVYTRQE